jgi:hypothetical protein
MQISHIINFMQCHGFHLCLASMRTERSSFCWCACFTKDAAKMPMPETGVGTYQTAIEGAALKVFAKHSDVALLWAEESLRGLYRDKD